MCAGYLGLPAAYYYLAAAAIRRQYADKYYLRQQWSQARRGLCPCAQWCYQPVWANGYLKCRDLAGYGNKPKDDRADGQKPYRLVLCGSNGCRVAGPKSYDFRARLDGNGNSFSARTADKEHIRPGNHTPGYEATG
ncbi:hypothetical protein ES703_95033 [subsurface metagenome]